MSANLVTNVKLAIENQNVKSVTGWTDSTVVLHRLNQRGKYKQFVGKIFDRIKEKYFVRRNYVLTKENPAEKCIREGLILSIPKFWWKGPAWLPDMKKWPDQPRIEIRRRIQTNPGKFSNNYLRRWYL